MGASSSKDKGKKKKSEQGTKVVNIDEREYIPPEKRALYRYHAAEEATFVSAYEASIDKYDYLLVFPLTSGQYQSPLIDKEEDKESMLRNGEAITWATAKALWKEAIPGGEKLTNEAVEVLQRNWRKIALNERMPEPDDAIRIQAWKTLARDTIVDRLTNNNGLQLKLSANEHFIFCRIRAPIKILEIQADKEDYNLQLQDEIDPGSDRFWNVEWIGGESKEVNEERKLLEIDEAVDILERLYRAGKCSQSECGVNSLTETKPMYSRRVHALERIADKVPVYNKYIPYAPFISTKPHLRYLYKTYQSVRGTTLFRSKDRLSLTKQIIDRSIDMDILSSSKPRLVYEYFALHDANRGEKVSIEYLRKLWVYPWRGSAAEVGSPTVTHPAYEGHHEVWFYLRPFCQPIVNIQEYFGEEIAMFFTWFGYFTYCLIFPALLGGALELVFFLRGYVNSYEQMDYYSYGYFFLLLTWAVLYDQGWQRECKAVAVKWGTRGFESVEKDRPEFEGDPENPTVRSVVTNRLTTHFPDSKRVALQFGSNILICLLMLADLLAMGGLFYVQVVLDAAKPIYFYTEWADWIISLLIAFTMQTSSVLFRYAAKRLNNNENYRTETEYNDQLVLKVLLFEMVNSLAAPLFTTYAKGYLFNSCINNCVDDLRVLLYAIVIIRMTKTCIFDVALAFYSRAVKTVKGGSGGSGGGKSSDSVQPLRQESEEDVQFIQERDLETYPGVLGEFFDAYMQFTYLNLFAVAVPILPIISLFENLIMMRFKAYRLCHHYRRPHAQRAEDAGKWADYMVYMIYLGIYNSVATFTLSMEDLAEYNILSRIVVCLVICQTLVLYVVQIKHWYSDTPEDIKEVYARHDFILEKYIKSFEDDDENLDVSQFADSMDDIIDVDGMSLYDFRKVHDQETGRMTIKPFNGREKEKLMDLERQRRDVLRRMQAQREQLQQVYKSEVFDEIAGVGRTKSGVPLGRITVNIMDIIQFDDGDFDDLDEKGHFKIKCFFEEIGVEDPETGDMPEVKVHKFKRDHSYTKALLVTSGDVVPIDQVLGPFAPIPTIHARIVFQLVKEESNNELSGGGGLLGYHNTEAILATAACMLTDLRDQQLQDKQLPLHRMFNSTIVSDPTDAMLRVTLQFQYSKIAPLRNRLFELQGQLHLLEREMANMETGKVELAISGDESDGDGYDPVL